METHARFFCVHSTPPRKKAAAEFGERWRGRLCRRQPPTRTAFVVSQNGVLLQIKMSVASNTHLTTAIKFSNSFQ